MQPQYWLPGGGINVEQNAAPVYVTFPRAAIND